MAPRTIGGRILSTSFSLIWYEDPHQRNLLHTAADQQP